MGGASSRSVRSKGLAEKSMGSKLAVESETSALRDRPKSLAIVERIFARNGELRTIRAGETLLEQDIFSGKMFFIKQGHADLVLASADGDPAAVELARRGAGDVLGELGMLLGHAPSASVIAATELIVIEVEQQSLLEQLRENPLAAGQLFKVVSTYLAERISELSTKMRSNVTKGQEKPKEVQIEPADMLRARQVFGIASSERLVGMYPVSVKREQTGVKEANAHFGDMYIFEKHFCFDIKMFAFHRQMTVDVADVSSVLRSESEANTAELQSRGNSLEVHFPEGFEEALLLLEACRVKTKAMVLHKSRSGLSDKVDNSGSTEHQGKAATPRDEPVSLDDFHHAIEPIISRDNNPSAPKLAGLDLTEGDWKHFLGVASQRWYKKGEYLVHEGAQSATLYQVIQGVLRVEMQLNEEAQAVVVGHRGPGEMLGETSLLKEGIATASVAADQDSLVLCLHGRSLEHLFREAPTLPSRFFCFLAMYQANRLYMLTRSFAAEKPHVSVAANLVVSLEEIMQNSAYGGIFRKFLVTSMDEADLRSDDADKAYYLGLVTLLDFHVLAQSYAELPDRASLVEGAASLHCKYLSSRASTSLSSLFKERTIERIDAMRLKMDELTVSVVRKLFEEAQQDVLEILQQSCYKAFLGSTQYRYIIDLKAKEKIVPKLSDFRVVRVLGEGGFGQVIDVMKRDCGIHYAMKVMNKDAMKKNLGSTWRKKIATEQSIMATLHHPFLVNLQYAFQNQDFLILVMDIVPSGDLSEFVLTKRRLTPEQVCWVLMEVVEVLSYMHAQQILYRDLKPENLLVDAEGHVRLIDMGLAARVVEKTLSRTSRVGTDCYMAPEVRWARKRRTAYSFSADWYTVGVLLYEFTHGALPYTNRDTETPQYRGGTWPSEEAKLIAESLMVQDHRKRLGSGPRGALEIKEHSYFFGVDWEVVTARTVPSPMKGVKGIPKRRKDKEAQAQRTAADIEEADKSKSADSAQSSESNIPSWDFVNPVAVTTEYMESVYHCVSTI